jgi:hypothetical protein
VQDAALLRPLSARFGWLSNPTFLLCVAGVVLPNLLSIGAFVAGIGAPPRPGLIMAYATLVIVARLVSPFITAILFLALVAYDAIWTLALSFNLAPREIGLAIHLSRELRLFESPFYMMMIASLAAMVIVNIAVLTIKRDTLRRGNVVVMMGLAAIVATVDFLANTSPHYQFGTLYAAGKPMESAVGSSGFRTALQSHNGRNVLLVVVEALGQFRDPAQQALLLQPFHNTGLLRRYAVTSGSTTYYGSTTAAEMRELCNTREPYDVLIEGKSMNCLPAQMSALGYRTVSLHNFTSAFFDRDLWYPKLGFEQRIFGQDIRKDLHRACGGPFKGACDVDLLPMIVRQLREAGKPTFFYWMTLSTHVPIAPHEGTARLDCANGGGRIGHTEVCYMTEMWMDLFDGIVRATADLPPMEVLIVGDHAPPLWSRVGRNLFTPGQVPWVRLTPKSDGAEVSSAEQLNKSVPAGR